MFLLILTCIAVVSFGIGIGLYKYAQNKQTSINSDDTISDKATELKKYDTFLKVGLWMLIGSSILLFLTLLVFVMKGSKQNDFMRRDSQIYY
jgi:hypothetical protein